MLGNIMKLCVTEPDFLEKRFCPKNWENGSKIEFLKFIALQIPNSLGDKFSQWDSQNETLITHYEKKKTEATLNVSYFEKTMSHWEYT